MKGKFIEDSDLKLGLMLEPETDDERLLLRQFGALVDANDGWLAACGWGLGGEKPGLRHLKLRILPVK